MLRHIFTFWVFLSSFALQAQVYLDLEQKTDIPVTRNGAVLNNAWAGGLNYVQVNKMDLDQDGREDLVLFDKSGDRIITFIDEANSGAPDYQFAPHYADSFPDFRYWMILEDYNCDGKKDLFVKVSSGVGVYENVSGPGELRFEWALGSKQFLESDYGTGGVSNISVIAVDIPVIEDMNGDSAIDIVTFALLGTNIQLHENTQPCGLDFFLRTNCWGGILENPLSNSLYLDTCDGTGKKEFDPGSRKTEKTLHAGSTLCAIDLQGDGAKDLLLGDISFNNTVAAYNTGTPDVAFVTSQDTNFPSYDQPIDLYVFPATYYEDVDGDGLDDLLASPNISPAENKESVWFYKNVGTSNVPTFQKQQEDFLQGEMIDAGEAAAPVLYDYTGNGLPDLFIGSGGEFLSAGNYTEGIRYYVNTGTPGSPSFQLQSEDFGNISSLGLGRFLHPTFGDLNADGLPDMIVGTEDGELHYLRQTASGTFIVGEAFLDGIDVGQRATPFLYDLDGDSALDLLIGEQLGNINYYTQTSASPNLNFQLVTESFGGINLLSTSFGGSSGFSVPVIAEFNGKPQLFAGSFDRGMIQYDSLDNALSSPALIDGQFGQDSLVSTSVNQTPFGTSKRVGRNQYLITSDELAAQGLKRGFIDRLQLNVTTTNNPIMYDDLYISLKLTDSDSLAAFEDGLSEVYNNTFVPLGFTKGWNTIFLHRNFEWDGEKNIVLEICFSKNAPNPTVHVEGSKTAFSSNAYGDIDNNNNNSANGCNLPLLGTSKWRPNIKLSVIPGLQVENVTSFRGHHIVPAIADVNGDSILDVIIGNQSGGVEYFEGSEKIKIPDIGVEAPIVVSGKEWLVIYPNPSRTGWVSADISSFDRVPDYQLIDIRGNVLREGVWDSNSKYFDLATGVYIIRMSDGKTQKFARWVINK